MKDSENKKNFNNNSQLNQNYFAQSLIPSGMPCENDEFMERSIPLIRRKSDVLYNKCTSEQDGIEKVNRFPEISKSAPDPQGLALGCFFCSNDMAYLNKDKVYFKIR